MKDREFLQWSVEGARLFARCSKRQYMAVIVAPNGRVAGTGYNGAPAGMKNCTDGGCPRAIEGSASGSNYENCVAIHAEENALLFSDATARAGGTIYVNGPPCFGCAKKIANSGLRRIVYIEDEGYKDWPRIKTFLSSAGIKTVPINLEPVVKSTRRRMIDTKDVGDVEFADEVVVPAPRSLEVDLDGNPVRELVPFHGEHIPSSPDLESMVYCRYPECDWSQHRPWPGYCQACGASLFPADATACRVCGASDGDE